MQCLHLLRLSRIILTPLTTIQFSVAARSDIKVEIYAIDGTLVGVLVIIELEAGVYKTQ